MNLSLGLITFNVHNYLIHTVFHAKRHNTQFLINLHCSWNNTDPGVGWNSEGGQLALATTLLNEG